MAKAVATKEMVYEVATALVAAGISPSIVTAQAQIGGGSYTTIKRFLDEWSKEQSQGETAAVETPAAVTEKCAELGRELWVMASREANREAQVIKDAADGKVQEVTSELAFAQGEISRMELEAEDSAKSLAEALGNILDLRKALQNALAQSARIVDLQTQLEECKSELATSRDEARNHAVEAGRLKGEAESLQSQLRDITAALVSLKREAPNKG